MSDIRVEVVYALPERQYLRKVKLAEGSSVEQAIQASGLLELRRDIDLKSNKIGIYSRPAKLGDTLNDGDRVEIYRPLIADPERAAPATAERQNKALIAPYFYLKLIFFRVAACDCHEEHHAPHGPEERSAPITWSAPVCSGCRSTRLRCRRSASASAG